MEKIKTIILAAGEGTRMKSEIPKVLHQVAGKTLLQHVLDSAQELELENDIAVVVGHKKEEVKNTLPDDVQTFIQEEQNGTGHAIMQAEDFFKDSDSIVLVLNGDAPLIRPETLLDMYKAHKDHHNTVTVMTTELDNPTGYGRIIKEHGQILKIVEEKDASDSVKNIKEVNAGTYCFDAKYLADALKNLTTDNAQKEYYLTDAVEIIRSNNKKVGAYCVEDSTEVAAVNSRIQLAQAAEIFRERVNTELMENGVTILAPENTYIDSTVRIDRDTIIYPGVLIEGDTDIGKNCTIGLNSHIVNTKIADNVEIENSTIYDSYIDSETVVGPYAYIRPDSHIGKDVKIGDFVEVKNSTIGNGTKASHLTYIGDADIGEKVNLGCGTVFVNYNGKDKNRTIVEDDCFIGCNANLVAPVKVKRGSYIAAGSTITDDVPSDSLAIARARQENKEDWPKKK